MTSLVTRAGVISVLILLVMISSAQAQERFEDNGDGTITDHQLGVMWAKTDNQGDINWKAGRQWVQFTFPMTLTTPYDNWRLPTLAELKSLFPPEPEAGKSETICGQKIRIAGPIQLTCGWVWTSEVRSITATVFNFQRGVHYTDRMVNHKAHRVLPVRDLKK